MGDGFGHALKGELPIDAAHLPRGAGHIVDGAAGLILTEGSGAGLPHPEEAPRAVCSRAGENDTEGAFPYRGGDGVEKHVDGGADGIDLGPGGTGKEQFVFDAPHAKLFAAGCDVDVIRPKGFAVDRFGHGKLRVGIQSISQSPGCRGS